MHLAGRTSYSLLACALLCAALAAFAVGCGGPPGGTSSAPPPFDVLERSIPELQAAMTDGRVTSRELVAQYLARIEAYDHGGPGLNAMIAINGRALDEADALDRERIASGPRGPLHGVPLLVKDNFDVAGMPTTAGSIALAEWYPPDDAFQVARLREAGAVIIGKANMHE
ncbi:MAG: amidase, partial [Acidobacteria bacterium]|nr:amidase [Acidobacteriota bacterium]